MNLLKILLATTRKRSESPTERRRRLLREAFAPAPARAQREPGHKR